MAEKREPVKELLKRAYIRLLCRKPYTDITVTDLITEAGVARVSYYRSFDSFGDIINEIFSDFYDRINEDIFPLFLENSENAMKVMISGFFKKLKDSNITKFPSENIQFAFSALSKKIKVNEPDATASIRQRYAPIINISILFAVVRKWAVGGFAESTEEISDFVCSVISGVLKE